MENQGESHPQITENNNDGMQSLSKMPSWNEHIKSFEDAKKNNKIPEGVRDEQDYNEYAQEQAARLKEAKDFIYEHFGQYTNSYGDEVADELANSMSLEAFVKSGITLDTLLQKGIISVKSPDTGASPDPDPWNKEMLFTDTAAIIVEIGALFTEKERGEDFNTFSGLKTAIEKWDNPSELTEDDIMNIIIGTKKGPLEHRLLFGNPFREDDVSLINHTTKTLSYITHGGYDAETNFDIVKEIDQSLLYDHKLGAGIPLENRKYQTGTENKIKKAIGEAVRARIEDFAKAYKDFDESYDLIERNIYAGPLIYDSVGLKDICQHHELLNECHIPESCLIEAVFYSDKEKDAYKEHDGKHYYNAFTLPQYVDTLLKSGFDKKDLVSTMHCQNKDIGIIPIHNGIYKMRNAGLDDVDIAYSLNAYEHYHPGLNENDPPKWDIKEYEDANFSERDLLKAALRDIKSRV